MAIRISALKEFLVYLLKSGLTPQEVDELTNTEFERLHSEMIKEK